MVYVNYDKIKYNFALSRQNKVQPFVFAAVKVVKIFDICKYFSRNPAFGAIETWIDATEVGYKKPHPIHKEKGEVKYLKQNR